MARGRLIRLTKKMAAYHSGKSGIWHHDRDCGIHNSTVIWAAAGRSFLVLASLRTEQSRLSSHESPDDKVHPLSVLVDFNVASILDSVPAKLRL